MLEGTNAATGHAEGLGHIGLGQALLEANLYEASQLFVAARKELAGRPPERVEMERVFGGCIEDIGLVELGFAQGHLASDLAQTVDEQILRDAKQTRPVRPQPIWMSSMMSRIS